MGVWGGGVSGAFGCVRKGLVSFHPFSRKGGWFLGRAAAAAVPCIFACVAIIPVVAPWRGFGDKPKGDSGWNGEGGRLPPVMAVCTLPCTFRPPPPPPSPPASHSRTHPPGVPLLAQSLPPPPRTTCSSTPLPLPVVRSSVAGLPPGLSAACCVPECPHPRSRRCPGPTPRPAATRRHQPTKQPSPVSFPLSWSLSRHRCGGGGVV